MAVPTIPSTLIPVFENLSLTSGIPASWIAAVCSASNFDNTYQTINNNAQLSTRQYGIAGIWFDEPEVSLPIAGGIGIFCVAPHHTYGGWAPQLAENTALTCACAGVTTHTNSTGGLIPPTFDQTTVLNSAVSLLKVCRDQITAVFGSGAINPLLFYKWVLGCSFVPQADANDLGLLPIIPGALSQAAWDLVAAQAAYAEVFGEIPIVISPTTSPPCPDGYTFNSLNGECCNSQNQCINATVCPQGTIYDSAHNACVVAPCSALNPCPIGSTCTNGVCLANCSDVNPCPAGFVCANGVCVVACSDTNACPTGQECQGGVCIPIPPSGSTLWPWLVVGGLATVWLGASALHEKGMI